MKQMMVKMEKIRKTIPPDQYLLDNMYKAVTSPNMMLSIPVIHMNCLVNARASHM